MDAAPEARIEALRQASAEPDTSPQPTPARPSKARQAELVDF